MRIVDVPVYRGVLDSLYRVTDGVVYVSSDNGDTWRVSEYGRDIQFFEDGISRGYLKAVPDAYSR